MYYLVWDVAFTKFFITPLTLSRHHKLTASKTLPSRFTMKSTSLKSTLVICLSICRIVRKKMQFGCLWVQNKISGSISKKKSNWNSSNLEKCYQITILSLLSIFQTWDLKKKLGQDTRWPTMVWELKKSQKTWNYYLLDRKMSKMPSLSRDTDVTKFGGENVQK